MPAMYPTGNGPTSQEKNVLQSGECVSFNIGEINMFKLTQTQGSDELS